jgi:chloramphenicol 3-O-phosphotransferase
MLRYSMSFYDPVGIERDDDGEYVLYEQHCDEIKRIRAEALKDAAERAVACYISLVGGRVPVDEADLRAAIYAGEVKE